MATDFFFLLNISYSDGTIILFQKVKDQIEAIIEQLGEDQEKSSIKSKKSSSSNSSSEHENDEADTGNGLRYSIYIRTVISFSSCQRNLIKTFQIEGMIALITKMDLIFS